MELFTHPVPAVIVLLGVLVLVHEAGHYLVGRWCGIAVEIFSIGFGPRIVGFHWGGTDYRISWIPLGGYVKFAGSHPSEEIPDDLKGVPFLKASLFKRSLTIFAGPFANFLLAIGVYTVLGMDGIPHPPPTIGEVIEGSPAEAAGIRYGDRFVRIDGQEITTWRDLESIIASSPGKTLTVTLARDGQERQVQLTPGEVSSDLEGKGPKVGRAGIALGSLPAIVTVTGADTPAAHAGLKTGDRVAEVTSGDQTTKVISYPDLARILTEAAQNPATAKVTLTVHHAPLPSASVSLPKDARLGGGNGRKVEIDLSAAAGASGKEALRRLGLADSQLTVAEATDTLAGQLLVGDRILAWNGVPLRDVYQLREQLVARNEPTAKVTVQREYEEKTLDLTLKPVETQRPEGAVTVYTLPLMFWGQPEEPDPLIEKYDGLFSALRYGVRETGAQTATLVAGLKALVTGEVPLKALGGPMLIAKVAGDSARSGWQTFVMAMALISINLGLLNLLPIPVLDGGQLVLMAAEGVKRRPLREAAIENFQKVGFAMILALVVLATYNDLSRFWRSMLESVVGIFQ